VLVASPPDPGAIAGALAPLLEDEQLRRRLGERGRERFEREFTAEAWATRLRAVYETAAS
jgi:glycosyltransferase involved in cell wall biosynthesis